MKFIKIFERKNRYEDGVNLSLIVDVPNLTDEQYDSLEEYLDEASERIIYNVTCIEGVQSHEVTNISEFLEDMPLPDGTIIGAPEFKELGHYVVVLGTIADTNSDIIIGVRL